MNEVVFKDTSRVLIETLRAELQNQAESFVKVGYLLKAARDTDVLKDTSYSSVQDMAKTEYGLSPDMVSRYIRIYERFGEGEGRLKSNYQGYGVAKLQIMITLPDEINEQLSPEMTKSQITEVAAEVHEEQKISDMEVMCEDPSNKEWNELQQFFMAYLEDHKQQFLMISPKPFPDETDYQEFKEIFFPNGTEMIFTRVPQRGKVMLASDGAMTYIRSGERVEYSWEEIYKEIGHELPAISNFSYTDEGYAEMFGADPVAPVQKPEIPKGVQKKPQSVPKEPKSVSKDEKTEEPEEIRDEDVPGQAIITPDGIEVQAAGEVDDTAENPDEAAGKSENKDAADILRCMRATLNDIERYFNEADYKRTTSSLVELKDLIAKFFMSVRL